MFFIIIYSFAYRNHGILPFNEKNILCHSELFQISIHKIIGEKKPFENMLPCLSSSYNEVGYQQNWRLLY